MKNNITINTERYLFFRKDVMACTFLSLPSKLILSSLLARQKSNPLRTHSCIAHSLYALSPNDVNDAFNELNEVGFFESMEKGCGYYDVTLSKEMINQHFWNGVR